jgi:hypothetical protein
MTPTRVLSLIVVIALLSFARIARAAEYSLWPVAEVDEAYDDNVRNASTNAKGDFLTAESLGATLEAEAARRSFFLTYSTTMIEHASYPKQDSLGENHYFGLHDLERLTKNTNLSISNSFLVGNASGGFFLTNGSTPIGSQLLSSLLYHNATAGNDLALDLYSKYSNSFTWFANIHQVFFSTLSSSPSSESASGSASSSENFDQGGSIGGDWLLRERFTAGAAYSFDDFRFSNGQLPTTDAHWPMARLGWGAGTPITLTAQVGPIIAQSSSGVIGTTHHSSQTKVDVGYLVRGEYAGRRLLLSGTAGQIPNLSAGLGAYSTSQTYAALIQYKLTRRIIPFANFGFYGINATGVSTDLINYSAGVSYRATRMLTFNVQYLGYQQVGGGFSTSGLLGPAAGSSITNLFEIGITVTPLPFKWRS